MTDFSQREHRFTGWHMWLLAIAFFGTIIGVNIWLAVVSATSWTGMAVDDSYIAGTQFETLRKAHEAQVSAGWTADFAFTGGKAQLTVLDKAGRPVELGEVSVLVSRPVGGHEDQHLVFQRDADGIYRAPLQLPSGAWDAAVSAPDTPLGPFELNRRFVVGAEP